MGIKPYQTVRILTGKPCLRSCHTVFVVFSVFKAIKKAPFGSPGTFRILLTIHDFHHGGDLLSLPLVFGCGLFRALATKIMAIKTFVIAPRMFIAKFIIKRISFRSTKMTAASSEDRSHARNACSQTALGGSCDISGGGGLRHERT